MLLELPRPRMQVLTLAAAVLVSLSAGIVDAPFAPFVDNRTDHPLVVQAVRDEDGHTFIAHLDESVDAGESRRTEYVRRSLRRGSSAPRSHPRGRGDGFHYGELVSRRPMDHRKQKRDPDRAMIRIHKRVSRRQISGFKHE